MGPCLPAWGLEACVAYGKPRRKTKSPSEAPLVETWMWVAGLYGTFSGAYSAAEPSGAT